MDLHIKHAAKRTTALVEELKARWTQVESSQSGKPHFVKTHRHKQIHPQERRDTNCEDCQRGHIMIAAVKEVSKVSSLVFYKILDLTKMLLLSSVQNPGRVQSCLPDTNQTRQSYMDAKYSPDRFSTNKHTQYYLVHSNHYIAWHVIVLKFAEFFFFFCSLIQPKLVLG